MKRFFTLSRGELDIAVFYPPLDRGYAKIRYGIWGCGVEQAGGGTPQYYKQLKENKGGMSK